MRDPGTQTQCAEQSPLVSVNGKVLELRSDQTDSVSVDLLSRSLSVGPTRTTFADLPTHKIRKRPIGIRRLMT
jgi:hypothetical protein